MKIFSDDMKAILDRADEVKSKLKDFGFAEIEIDFRIEVLKRGFAGLAYTGETGYMYVDERKPRLGTEYRERPVVKISPTTSKNTAKKLFIGPLPTKFVIVMFIIIILGQNRLMVLSFVG